LIVKPILINRCRIIRFCITMNNSDSWMLATKQLFKIDFYFQFRTEPRKKSDLQFCARRSTIWQWARPPDRFGWSTMSQHFSTHTRSSTTTMTTTTITETGSSGSTRSCWSRCASSGRKPSTGSSRFTRASSRPTCCSSSFPTTNLFSRNCRKFIRIPFSFNIFRRGSNKCGSGSNSVSWMLTTKFKFIFKIVKL